MVGMGTGVGISPCSSIFGVHFLQSCAERMAASSVVQEKVCALSCKKKGNHSLHMVIAIEEDCFPKHAALSCFLIGFAGGAIDDTMDLLVLVAFPLRSDMSV